MKIVAISDIHNYLDSIQVPSANILIIAGDATNFGSIAELNTFNENIGKIKKQYNHIVLVYGNHELLAETNPTLTRSILTNIDHVLHDSSITIKDNDGKDIKIYGSPHTIEYGGWAFNLPRGSALKAKWDLIPDDVDILITHQPPYGILDEAGPYSGHVGCPDLLDAILRVKPKLHVFGHLHWSHGIKDFNGTTFVNAAICGHSKVMNLPVNKPVEIEI